MIRVVRFGFPRRPPNEAPAGPLQDALSDVLTRMENNGHQVISASVIADPTKDERYEVYVVSRVKDEKDADPT